MKSPNFFLSVLRTLREYFASGAFGIHYMISGCPPDGLRIFSTVGKSLPTYFRSVRRTLREYVACGDVSTVIRNFEFTHTTEVTKMLSKCPPDASRVFYFGIFWHPPPCCRDWVGVMSWGYPPQQMGECTCPYILGGLRQTCNLVDAAPPRSGRMCTRDQ